MYVYRAGTNEFSGNNLANWKAKALHADFLLPGAADTKITWHF